MTSVSPRRNRIASGQIRVIAYWTTTAVLATECFVGGVMGAFQLQPFKGVVTHLGYPLYFMTILGVCYMSAGVVLLAPRLPRLKEWAYAGLTFIYIGAIASHIWVRDDAKSLIGPLIFAALAATSWALRPAARRDFDPG
jgi:DoxX-like protein